MHISIQRYALMPLASAKEGFMKESLWCVHLPELGDFIAMPSEEAATQEALAINASMKEGSEPSNQSECRAVAVRWPFSSASHERALGVDWDDLERMPHRRLAARVRKSGVSSLTQWISDALGKLRAADRKR
jgi:hypothetical protein